METTERPAEASSRHSADEAAELAVRPQPAETRMRVCLRMLSERIARTAHRRGRALGPWSVAGTVFLLYGIILGLFIALGHDPRDMARLGRSFVALGGRTSSVIRLDPHYPYPAGNIGYDGQFYTFIALDPQHASAYLDNPAGRMGRILYPLVARAFALGQPALIPWALILVNWLAIALGTWLTARWLARRHVSPWWALVYGLSAGLAIGLTHDLTEPLAYALALAGLLVLDGVGGAVDGAMEGNANDTTESNTTESNTTESNTTGSDADNGQFNWGRLLMAGELFALAALARETTLVFPVAVAVSWCLRDISARQDQWAEGVRGWLSMRSWHTWRPALALLAVAGLPYLAWKVALRVWLGPGGVPVYWLPAPYPFAGLIAWWPWHALQMRAVLLVAVPALLVAPLAAATLRTRERGEVAWALALNLVWLVIFLPYPSWADINGSARLSDGVVLAAVLCVPSWTRRQRAWFLVPGVLWCLLTPPVLRALLRGG